MASGSHLGFFITVLTFLAIMDCTNGLHQPKLVGLEVLHLMIGRKLTILWTWLFSKWLPSAILDFPWFFCYKWMQKWILWVNGKGFRGITLNDRPKNNDFIERFVFKMAAVRHLGFLKSLNGDKCTPSWKLILGHCTTRIKWEKNFNRQKWV